MDYVEITVPCPECDGFGTVESQRPVGNSEGKDYYITEIECEECFGSGEDTKGNFYNSLKEAKEAYPNAISTRVIR